MMEEENLRTASALSDGFREFLRRFKDESGFKYVDRIVNCIKANEVIDIEHEDLTKEINDSFKNLKKPELRYTIYRAVKEIFENDEGVSRTDTVVEKDRIQIRFNGEVFGNPKNEIENDVKQSENNEDDLFKKIGDDIINEIPIRTLRDTEQSYFYKNGVFVEGADVLIKEKCEKTQEKCFFKWFIRNNNPS